MRGLGLLGVDFNIFLLEGGENETERNKSIT